MGFTFDKPADNWFESRLTIANGGRGAVVSARRAPEPVQPWHSKEIWLRRIPFRHHPGQTDPQNSPRQDAEVYLNGKLIKSFGVSLELHRGGRDQRVLGCAADWPQYVGHPLQTDQRRAVLDAGLVVDQSKTPVPVLARLYGKEVFGETKLNEYNELREELEKVQSIKVTLKSEYAMAVAKDSRRKMWILRRDMPTLKGEEVGPAFPEILAAPAAHAKRVHCWQGNRQTPCFGRVDRKPGKPDDRARDGQPPLAAPLRPGIVRSSNNFGFIGENSPRVAQLAGQ